MSVINEVLAGRLSFSIPEMLSLLGCAQCIYILVYLCFRSGKLSLAVIPMLFFFCLGVGFALDLAESSWSPLIKTYEHWQWLFWFLCAPLSVLLVIQVAQISKMPHWEFFFLLLTMPVGYFIALMFTQNASQCPDLFMCEETIDWLLVVGVIISASSLLTIWLKKDLLNNVLQQKRGRERFWLIIAIVTLNIALIMVFSAAAYELISLKDASYVRIFIGFAFVYLAASSLFRIYPQAVIIKKKVIQTDLTDEEHEYALKIERLLNIEKIYHEPAYGRSNFAQELGVTESFLSKIVNQHFGKSVPQLLNAYRIDDAKSLLIETGADLATISEEAGFNSVTTFNRYFKELEGVTPSEFRSIHKVS